MLKKLVMSKTAQDGAGQQKDQGMLRGLGLYSHPLLTPEMRETCVIANNVTNHVSLH